MQVGVVYCLNHDLTASFRINRTSILQNSAPPSSVYWHKGALICLSTTYQGAEILYTYIIWM